jgi:fructokinase
LYDLLDATPNALHFLDINLRKDCFSTETLAQSLQRSNVLKLNRDEVKTLAKMFNFSSEDLVIFCSSIFKSYERLKTVLITLGEAGVLCLNRDSKPVYVAGCEVTVADTIGAGDAFSAGYIIKHLEKQPLKETLEFANALAAVSATKKGGMGSIEKGEVEAFRSANNKRSILDDLAKFS